MGEKVYKPIVKEGDHLIHSKENPDRIRGLTRDENNQNPDIIEFEEYDLDDLMAENCDPYPYRNQDVELTAEQEYSAEEIGEALALGVMAVVGGVALFRKVVLPWWSNTAWPWLKEKGAKAKAAIRGRKAQEQTAEAISDSAGEPVADGQLAEVTALIDQAFEQTLFEMDEDEAQEHLMRLIYHTLGLANEIRIMSNARIRKDCESDELCIEKQKQAEQLLTERVALCLDQALSSRTLSLDLNTSKELFSLTGGGVRLNGEYVPIQPKKIEEVLHALPIMDKREEVERVEPEK